MQTVRESFPDNSPRVEQALADADLVVVRVIARGTHPGTPFPPGIPASGRPIEWREQHVFRIVDGRIVEHWGVFYNLAIFQQLGAVPAPS